MMLGRASVPARLLCVQKEGTFRCHLLMCFMDTTAIKMISDVLAKSKTSLSV